MSTLTDHDSTYTYDQAAARIGVSVRTLRRMVHDGRVPHHRFGSNLVRFTPDDIREIIDMHRIAPRPRSSRSR